MRFLKYLITALGFSLLAASPAVFADNKGYAVMTDPQPTDAGKKVEVIEFFSYTCPHCFGFDPGLKEWVKKQGDNIVFKRIPVGFRPDWVPHQKVYYALEAMGKVEEYHQQIFDAVHVQHAQLRTDEDMINFMVKLGLDKQKFTDAYTSFSVNAKVKRVSQLLPNYKVEGVPLIVIDGRYTTAPDAARGLIGDKSEPELRVAALKVMDDLVLKSKKK
jgi:thiol:disulfide interchange protein DsbA